MFQPAGFPDIGHVLYQAPGANSQTEQICVVDSPASMANHLEAVCFENPQTMELHSDLEGLPYVQCLAKDSQDSSCLVVTTLSEGHRLASDYFIGKEAKTSDNNPFINKLRDEFGIKNLGKTRILFQKNGGRSSKLSFATIRTHWCMAFSF